MKLKLDHLELGQKEMRAEIKDLSRKMERKFDNVERKFDKTDGKIDRVLYGIITGLVGFVLKGGFDYYQTNKKYAAKVLVSAVESIDLERLVTD